MTNVESVTLFTTAALIADMTNDTALTSLTSSGATTGTVTFQGFGTSVPVTIQDTDRSHTLTFSSVTGTADTATVNLKNVTAGTLTVAGIETLTINSGSSINTVAVLAAADTTKLVVTGDKALTITTNAATVANIDASAATGIVTASITPGAASLTGGSANDVITFAGTGAVTAAGGAGDDTLVFGTTFLSTDSVDGGDGTDILSLDVDTVDAAAITTALTTVSNVETLNLIGFADANTVTTENISSTINRVNLSAVSGAFDNTLAMGTGAQTVGINVAIANAAGQTLTVDASGSGTADSLAITNMLTALNLGSATSAFTVTDFESVSINTGTYTTAALQNMGALSLGSTTAVTISGANALTIAAGFVGASLDASGLTGDALLTMSGAATTVTSITGSANADVLVGDSSSSISGGAGNDNITGGATNDTVLGGAGDDTITSGAGNDSIDAGAGDDRVLIVAAANLTSNDVIVGGDGTDTLAFTTAAPTDAASSLSVVSGFEVLEYAAGGVSALTMSNFLNNSGFTRIDLGDFAAGGATLTNISSTVTDFRFITGAVTDSFTLDRLVDGSANAATFSARADFAAAITALTALDEETMSFSGSAAANDLTISTVTVEDLTTLNVTGAADVIITTLTGAVNLATVNASTSTGAVTISAASSVENITATAGSGVFTFTGGNGADTITGGAAIDALVGGAGADSITAGAADDEITGGTGNDTLTGGDGADDFNFAAVGSNGIDTITDFVTASDDIDVATPIGNNAVTIVAVGGAQTTVDNTEYYISTNGTAANLTTAGTATLTETDLTATTLTSLAAYLDERFADLAGAGDVEVFVINWTANGNDTSYVYEFVSNTNADFLAAELTLTGIVQHTAAAILVDGDLI